MDGVGVKLDVLDEEASVAQCLFGEDSSLGDLLEGGGDRVFDVLQVLDALGVVEDHVGSVSRHSSQGGGLGLSSVVPDSRGLVLVPAELVYKQLNLLLLSELVAARADPAVFNPQAQLSDLFLLPVLFPLLTSFHTFVVRIFNDFLSSLDRLLFKGSDRVERAGLHPDSVLLVGGLGEAGLGAWGRDRLLVADDGFSLYDFAVLGVELSEVLHADLDMEVTAAGDDVLFGGLVLGDDDKRVGLRQLSEAVHQLGEVLGVLARNGHSDDRGDGVLHHSDVVGVLVISVHNGGLLLDIVIDSDDGAGVAAGDTGDWLFFTAHHEDGLLELYDVEGAFF